MIDFPADWPNGLCVQQCAAPSMRQWISAASSLLKRDRLCCSQHAATDCEASDALQLLFWGRKGGVALELGGLDGKRHSQTALLAEALGWRRIIAQAWPTVSRGKRSAARSGSAHPRRLCARLTARLRRTPHRSLRTWSVSRLPKPSHDLHYVPRYLTVGSQSSCPPNNSIRS